MRVSYGAIYYTGVKVVMDLLSAFLWFDGDSFVWSFKLIAFPFYMIWWWGDFMLRVFVR